MSIGSVLHIIGFDISEPDGVTLRSCLGSSVALVASKRLYEQIKLQFPQDLLPSLIPIVPLQPCIDGIK